MIFQLLVMVHLPSALAAQSFTSPVASFLLVVVGVYDDVRCDTAAAVCGSERHSWDIVSLQSAFSNPVKESDSEVNYMQ